MQPPTLVKPCAQRHPVPTLHPFLRQAGRLLVPLCTLAACTPPGPADPSLASAWIQLTDSLTREADATTQTRVVALAALAMYEGFAAEKESGLRSLAGQVNGLWSVPVPGSQIDGATAAAAAQRLVLDSLFAQDFIARSRVDALAARQLAARRAAGVPKERAVRSIAHGSALARTILGLTQQGSKTFVLRHPRECVFVAARSSGVVVQGGRAPSAPPPSAARLAERHTLDALTNADAHTSASRPFSAGCVHERVRQRLRTAADDR